MAEKFDIPSRLAEGRPAVDNIQTYVWACHMLGYANPDLTLHASQVSDWYGSEDALDLRALDADCAALEAAVAATEDALMRQDEQLAALSSAWQGGTADLSREFLRRHGEASAAAAAAVRTTADALATLRDNLWHAVDGKVAAAIAADDRAPGEWLAAAHTVTTGAGDRAAASERIDQEVKPFVDNDIRAEWLTAMRSAMAAVMESYDAATAELSAEPDAVFDVPGDLGPSWTPPPRDDEAATVPAAASSVAPPVAAAPPWGAPASAWAPAPAPPPVAPPPAPPVDPGTTAPAMSAPPSAPSLGGQPDVGSGLSGIGQQLADVFGSLLGSADDALAETPDIDEPELDEDVDDELDEDPEEEDEPVEPVADPEEEPAADQPVEAPAADETCEPAEAPIDPPPPEEPAPTPAPVPPPPPEPAPLADPAAAAETPCEIAADALPQVGE
ncbi:MAG TPA: hypothetical protein VFC01_25340 [Mycobacterium sp.]|nr:hypothetical protein [Mycobacterium sp.]